MPGLANDTDVLVVGAGPTGLMLAGDLAAAGVACTVLERRADEANLTRAFAVHARTLEELDARGVADELVATGKTITELRLFGRVHLDLSTLPSRFPYLLITPQYHVERVLRERAERLGARVVPDAEVVGLRQDADGVELDDRAGNTHRARYAVGADGIGSAVRKLIGQPFPGRAIIKSLMLADVRLADPPADVLAVNGVGESFAFVAPFGDGWYRVFAWNKRHQVPDDAPLDFDEVREATRRAHGTDFGMHDPRWLSRFHSDERQVPSYRVDRVFLAGDAAHVHSPAGGQGMNTGIQDAANLGWKLAATVRGWAPQGLLDSYQTERHPVGRMVLRSSGAIIRLALIGPAVLRAGRNLAAAVVLDVGPVARKVTGIISGIGIRYPRQGNDHPLTGQRAPDLALDGGGRLYEALRSGRFVLVGGSVDGWSDRVDAVRAADPVAPAVLVRPDAYVAWAGADPAGALREWCGPPA
jgi:2-polyprenyl-6-methoxyphenol hydroxylase-like FAD-dependent oxidoreductase